ANKRNITEDAAQPKTIFAYNETKKEAENWMFSFSTSTEMEITAIRPGNVFGPKDHTFIDKYLEAIETGKVAYVAGGKCWTCPTYIENLIDGILLACFENKAVGEAFIITDGLEIDWKTFTEKFAIAQIVKKPWLSIPFKPAYFIAFLFEKIYEMFDIESPPLLTRYRISNGGRDYHFSIEKAKRILNYKPKVDFDTAVTRTVEWYKNEFKI
ncbi:MAG: NAD-dependent epimerase/dehydratase family protein, partial [Melioribacteraceae bacterium]